jgi:hypothetical protein
VYNDIRDAYDEARIWHMKDPIVLARPEQFEEIRYSIASDSARIVKMRPKKLPTHSFDLSAFEDADSYALTRIRDKDLDVFAPRRLDQDFHETVGSLGLANSDQEIYDYEINLLNEFDYDDADLDFLEESDEYRDMVNRERARILDRFLLSIGMNSLLTELAIVFDRDRVKVVPYHSFSLHNVPATRDRLVLLRPGRVSSNYWRCFKKDIRALEELLNSRDTKEREIEMLLRKNPLFLRGLNYRKVYPQVILPLGVDNSLRPDAIAEPIDSDWCHIIDYKLPSQQVLVGRDNRLSLSAGIVQVASQLREYSAYFDERSVAKYVEQKYGFKCYKPRLVAIVGRDPEDLEPEQVRRAMTAFPDLEIVTYDRLLKAAKQYLRV